MRDLYSVFASGVVLLGWVNEVEALLHPIIPVNPVSNLTTDHTPVSTLPPITLPKTTNATTHANKTKTCSECFFNADVSTTLSYPHEVVSVTSVITLVPHITIYPNKTVTSWSTLTPNATFHFNVTTTRDPHADLSTELTWTWSGVALTYPTTYVAYDPAGLVGSVPTPTSNSFEKLVTCDSVNQLLPLHNSSEAYSSFVFPEDGTEDTTEAELLDYLAALPEIKSFYSGHDIHTCKTPAVVVGQNNPHDKPPPIEHTVTQDGPAPTQKTSVLVMATQTQPPIVVSVNTPAPSPLGQDQGPTPTPAAIIKIESILGGSSGNPASTGSPAPPPAGGSPGEGNPVGTQPAPVNPLGAIGEAIESALPVPGTAAKPAPAGITPAPAVPPTLSVAGQKVTANSAGQFVVAPGTTLTPGGPAQVIAGTTVSIGTAASGATIAVINGQTSTLSGAVPTFAAAAALTIDGTTFPPTVSAGSTFYVVDGTTLAQGQVATIHGTTLSLANGGGVLAINGTASVIPKATASVQYFEGGAAGRRVGWAAGALAVVAAGFGLVL